MRRRTIGDYLLLPVEAYNLLDPTWIRRALEFSATAITSGAETALTQSNGTDLMVDAPVSAHSSPIEHPESTVPPTMSVAQQQRARSNMGGTEPQSSKIGVNNASAGLLNAIDRLGSRADDAFVLTVPVEELTGLPVRPRVLVTVEGDRGTGGVLFRSAYVEFGSNVLDNRVKIDLRAHLFRRVGGPPDCPVLAPEGMCARSALHCLHGDFLERRKAWCCDT